MTIFLLINLCLVFCGLVGSSGDASAPQQTLPGQQTVYENPTEPILNLSNVDSSIFTTTSELKDDIRTTIYKAKSGSKVTSVAYDQELWKAEPGQALSSCTVYSPTGCSLMILDVDNGECLVPIHLSKECGRWITVSKEVFEMRLKDIRYAECLLELRRSLLDISSERYSDRVAVSKEAYDELVVSKFTVKSGSVTFVADCDSFLWRGEPGESCAYVWVHAVADSSICRVEYFDEGNVIWTKYYQKNDHNGHSGDPSWTSIDRHAYMQRHKAMHTSKPVRVDTAHIDPFMCEYIKYVHCGKFYAFGHPFDDYKVTSLTFGRTLIWKSTGGRYCIYFAYVKVFGYRMFELEIMGRGSESSKVYVELYKGEVRAIERKEYHDTIYGTALGKPTETARMNVMGPLNPIQYTIYGYKRGKTTMYTFIPCPSIRVNFVFKDHLKLWEAGNQHDRCLKAEYTPYHNGSSFLHVHAIVAGKVEHEYFQAVGQNGVYNEITEDEYMARLGLQDDSDKREDDARDDPPETEVDEDNSDQNVKHEWRRME